MKLYVFLVFQKAIREKALVTMRFRQFEFRLFPRMRSKKKKKTTGKLCNYDFPRDIGLDRNSNYSSNGIYGYCDNIAAEKICGNVLTDDICHNNGNYVNCCYSSPHISALENSLSKSSVSELRQGGDWTCECVDCMSASFPSERLGQLGPQFIPEAVTATPVGTPNTLPRTRTRIKTNPWLPSPRETPAPSPSGK